MSAPRTGPTPDDFTPPLRARVHAEVDPNPSSPVLSDFLDVLTPRRHIADSAFGEHLRRLRGQSPVPAVLGGWVYDPATARQAVAGRRWIDDPRFSAWTRACGDMADNAVGILDDVVLARRDPGAAATAGWRPAARARPARVRVAADRAGEVFARARSGANRGRTTKSLLGPCPHPAWLDVTREHGLVGANALPVITVGTHGLGLLTQWYTNWKQDYITYLDLMFYLEYNIDALPLGEGEVNRVAADICRALDVPDLPHDLEVRRLHMACGIAFFDAKRKHETLFSDQPTDGRTAWLVRDRDQWRDFKAMDSGILGQYTSFVPGVTGRDDLMLTGLAHDWVDIGPDLRNSEFGQSVLTLTRGSIECRDLLRSYERTVWMLNTQWTAEGDIKSDRYPACVLCTGVGMWATVDHRHDVWRYYAHAAEASKDAVRADLYRACGLAECYTEDLRFHDPDHTPTVAVPRAPLRFDTHIAGERHTDVVRVHELVVDAVATGTLPMSLVTNALITPLLLTAGAITPATFLSHMDRTYCRNAATLTDVLHASGFNRATGAALCALFMEQWWHGLYYAIGIGSLVEAQPGRVGHDRRQPNPPRRPGTAPGQGGTGSPGCS